MQNDCILENRGKRDLRDHWTSPYALMSFPFVQPLPKDIHGWRFHTLLMQSVAVFNHPSCWKCFLGASSVGICGLNHASPFVFSSLMCYFFLPLTILLSLFWTLSNSSVAASQIRLGILHRTLPQFKSPKAVLLFTLTIPLGVYSFLIYIF